MANGVVDLLTRVRYVGQDFQTYVDETLAFLKDRYPNSYNNFVSHDAGMALIDLVAYASMGLSFYINQRTTNLYMQTATSPNSIARISRMLNYTIEGSSVAAVDLTVTLKNGPYPYPVVIDNGFKFDGPNGLTFEYRSSQPVIYNPGDTVKTVTVYEGETRENVFISSGLENQVFSLTGIPTGKKLVSATVEFFVENEEWVEKSQIPYDIGNFFEVDYVSTPPRCKVGDGIAGSIPGLNKEIRIRFVIGSGTKGRVGAEQIKKAKSVLIASNNKIDLTVINANPSSGGGDEEDLRRVKTLAPQFFQSRDRAISKLDYDAISNTYPGVARADAHVVRNVDNDLTIMTNLNAISSSVSSVVDGIIEESSILIDAMYNEVSGIQDLANGLNDQVQFAILPYIATIHASAASMLTGSQSIAMALIATVTAYNNVILGKKDDIASEFLSKKAEIDNRMVLSQADIAALIAQVNATVSGCGIGVTTAVATLLGSISSEVNTMRIDVNGLVEDLETVVNGYGDDIVTNVELIGDAVSGVPDSLSVVLDPLADSISGATVGIQWTIANEIELFVDSVSGHVVDIESLVNQINAVFVTHTVGYEDQVSGYVGELYAYLDEVYSETCHANVVQVALLQTDQNNNYVSPASGLMSTLQDHLQDRADVVHSVRVIDGTSKVVPVSLRVFIRVSKNAIEKDVITRARDSLSKYNTQPYGLMVLRDYGKSLYKYEINKAIRDAQIKDTDIEYANVYIDAPVNKLDYDGNLIISRDEIIVPASVVVEKILIIGS